jgi:hypothetical protein
MARSAIQINLRIKPELRSRLKEEADRREISVTKEINDRLEHSFDERQQVDIFRNEKLYGILQVVANAMQSAGEVCSFFATARPDSRENWFDDPYAFEQARLAAIHVLECLQPDGEVIRPKAVTNAETLGAGLAQGIIEEAASGFTRTGGTVDRARRLHRDLGPFAERLKKFCSEEWLNVPTHIGDDQ